MTLPLPERPRLITFDTYGTLIDWDAALRRCMADVLERKGADVDVAAFYQRWYYDHALPAVSGRFVVYRQLLQESLQAALKAAGLPVEPDDGAELGDAMAAAEPFPDAVETLARLREIAPLATISNSQHDIITESARLLGDPFTHIFTGEVVEAYKPAPQLFELVLERAGVTPAETVHVAQSQYVDLPRSIPMGMATVWINRQGQELNEGTPTPSAMLPDLTLLPALLGEAAPR